MLQFYSQYATMLELEKREREKELERKLKYRELLWAAGQSQPRNKLGREIAHWFGTQMISWGSKLQNINTMSPTDITVNTKLTR